MHFSATATADAENSQPEPEQFARLVNALSRLTREALAFQKYHDASAKAQAAQPNYLDPSQKPSQKAQDILLHGWRNFFGHDLTQPIPDVVGQTSPSADSEASSPPLPSLHNSAVTVAAPAQPSRTVANTASPSVPPSLSPLSSLSSLSSLGSHPLTVDPDLPTNPATETQGNLQKPNSPPEPAAHENQNSQEEHCLECHAPLPALRPDHRRPSARCENCDIAWAGALATHAHTERRCEVGAYLLHENGWTDGSEFHLTGLESRL